MAELEGNEPETVIVEQAVTTAKQQTQVRDGLKVLLWAVVLVVVLSIVSTIRTFQFGGAVNDLNTAVEELKSQTEDLQDETNDLQLETAEARKASIEARDALQAAIEQSQQSSAGPVQDALLAIARIEAYLCDGKCDVELTP